MPASRSLLSGRLAALADAGFVPTPPCVQERLRSLVTLPTRGRYTVLDLTCGRGDLLAPFDGPLADLCGVEINGVRAHEARRRFPHATIIHAPYEETAVSSARVSLGLANFPYVYQDGERLEHLGIVELTRLLQPGGVLLTLLPARSAFHHTRAAVLINHLVKHYTALQVWRVPDDAFARFTQIVIGAIKRPQALKTLDEAPDEKRWLEQWVYRAPQTPDDSPWRGGTPPPELPSTPLATPYPIPIARQPLRLRVFRPDRAFLLQCLETTGVHTTPEWQRATSWSPGVALEQPLVPIKGEAHIAACAMLDMFACEEFQGPDGSRCTLLAHLAKEWVPVEPDLEERKEGVIAIEQEQDKLQLAVLDITRGTLSQYHGDAVYAFLEPWLPTMKRRLQERYPPLYDGHPDRWLVEATAAIGLDRTLKGSSTPGLVREQLETVWALWSALCSKGHVGLAGEQGVGKTRLTIALMAAFASAWQHREAFATHPPPWITKLERAWAANPRVPGTRPQALPCLIVCPLHVVESVWLAEIRAAWPEAECLIIDDFHAIDAWLARCAISTAPAVIALLSQSKTRATGRCWQPAVIRHTQTITHVDRSDAVGAPGEQGDRVHTRERFSCPQCGHLVVGTPLGTRKGARTAALSEEDEERDLSEDEGTQPSRSAQVRLDQDRLVPVGALAYFAFTPRTCSCGSPLWTAARTASVERRHPRLSYSEWLQATEALMSTLTASGPGEEGVRVLRAAPDPTAWKTRDGRPQARLAELSATASGPVCITVPDRSIDRTCPVIEQGERIGYTLPTGEVVTALYERRTRQCAGYVSQSTGQVLMKRYGFVAPPADSFSPFAFLKQHYSGLVAFTQVDESHNARNRDTDVGESIQQAQQSSQTYAHATGTPYGGLLKTFYYEQARQHMGFWLRLGFGWKEVGKAQALYGFSRIMTYEHEEPAHRGSGKTVTSEVRRSAPGLAVSLIPHLLSEWIDLSLETLGAHLPERIETPLLLPLTDPVLEERRTQMHQQWREGYWQVRAAQDRYEALRQTAGEAERDEAVTLAHAAWQEAQAHLHHLEETQHQEEAWITARDLRGAYRRAAGDLRQLAATHDAAKLAQDGLLRLWTVLPFWEEPRYTLSTTTRSEWGEQEEQSLLYQMPRLTEEYRYPLERQCYEVVAREVAAGRPIAIAFLQNGKRSTATRLEQVLHDFHPWTLTNDIAPNEREQAVKHAVATGAMVLLLPFQRTREGYNFQKEIPTGYWYEMPDRLFDLEQWQRRFWRLGQERDVHLYFPAMIGTAAFHLLSRLGMMSAGLSLFLGKTPTSGLARLVGADRTALARLSAALAQQTAHAEDVAEEEERVLSEQVRTAFAQRNAQYQALTSEHRAERQDEIQRWIWVTRRRALGLPLEPECPADMHCEAQDQPAGEHPWDTWRRTEQALRLEQQRQRAAAAREHARLRRMQDRAHSTEIPSPPHPLQGTLWDRTLI